MPETPHPRTILRGHKAQVHALAFVGNNDRLASGDAEGYVALWDLTIMRPTALAVWKLATSDEANLSKKLPLDDTSESRPQPWLLHLIDVNTMNFCAFAACVPTDPPPAGDDPELLLAVPNTLASESTRRHTVKSPGQNGMVMALALVPQGGSLTLLAGYENGVTTAMHLSAVSGRGTTYRAPAQPARALPRRGHTKHSGQQSLRFRDDGRVFATGGWDAMVRVYSGKTMKEVAVLKWHEVGCYAVAFAGVLKAPQAAG
ncbi:WD repeat-containing protein, partial [Verticillium dahliae]